MRGNKTPVAYSQPSIADKNIQLKLEYLFCGYTASALDWFCLLWIKNWANSSWQLLIPVCPILHLQGRSCFLFLSLSHLEPLGGLLCFRMIFWCFFAHVHECARTCTYTSYIFLKTDVWSNSEVHFMTCYCRLGSI